MPNPARPVSSSTSSAPTSGVQSLDRAAGILNSFAPSKLRLTASELARANALSTTTAHRLAESLARQGLLHRWPKGGYSLGPLILRLGRLAQASLDVSSVALPIMTELRDATGETVGLHVLRGLSRAVIDQVESREDLRRTYTDLGEAIPLSHGAPSKVLLAYLPAAEQAEILAGDLPPRTIGTITDPAQLRQELAEIRASGRGFSMQERAVGIHTVAVPIRDHTGAVTVSLSVTGPSSRVTVERLHDLTPIAQHAADELSAALGYDGPYWASSPPAGSPCSGSDGEE